MNRSVVLVVTEDSQGDRLDHFLGAHAPDLSRTRAKDIILSGLATLNGKSVKPSTRLTATCMFGASLQASSLPPAGSWFPSTAPT